MLFQSYRGFECHGFGFRIAKSLKVRGPLFYITRFADGEPAKIYWVWGIPNPFNPCK